MKSKYTKQISKMYRKHKIVFCNFIKINYLFCVFTFHTFSFCSCSFQVHKLVLHAHSKSAMCFLHFFVKQISKMCASFRTWNERVALIPSPKGCVLLTTSIDRHPHYNIRISNFLTNFSNNIADQNI